MNSAWASNPRSNANHQKTTRDHTPQQQFCIVNTEYVATAGDCLYTILAKLVILL